MLERFSFLRRAAAFASERNRKRKRKRTETSVDQFDCARALKTKIKYACYARLSVIECAIIPLKYYQLIIRRMNLIRSKRARLSQLACTSAIRSLPRARTRRRKRRTEIPESIAAHNFALRVLRIAIAFCCVSCRTVSTQIK